MASLSTQRLKAKTVKSYLTGVRSAYVDIGFDDLSMFYSAQLERIIAGIRRLHGEANTKERCPITKDVLLRILVLFNRSTRLGATLYVSFYLAFAAFLRVGEFTYTA